MLLILLISILFYIVNISENKSTILLIKSNDDITLTYNYDGKSHSVKGQRIEADEAIHIFAPPFYDLNDIKIDGITKSYEIKNGYYYMNKFSEEIDNDNQISKAIQISDKDIRIIIHPLENQILSIDLKDGYTLDDIKNNKELIVPANILSIDSNGNTLFNGKLQYIKGRGNISWFSEKKGYNLNFSQQESLANLPQTKKYTLIPSFSDMTGMRNKLVMDLANNLGLEHTSATEFVNVFIDGEFQGLYLLSQHVSVDLDTSKKQINQVLNEETYGIGDELKEIRYYNNIKTSNTRKYLIELEDIDRFKQNTVDSGFLTKRNNSFILHKSNNMAREEVLEIALRVQDLENSLYDIEDKKYLELIDLDSYSKQYLIELISQNIDSYRTSCYFYYDKETKKFYAGPVWDYDYSMGYGRASENNPKDMNLLNNPLSSKKELMKNVKKIFNEFIYKNKDSIVNNQINKYSKMLKSDMYLNALRYNQQNHIISIFNSDDYDYDKAIKALQEHLYKRIEYLNKLINSNNSYKKVNLNTNLITNNNELVTVMLLVEEGHSFLEDHEVPYYSSGDGFNWTKPLWISKWVDKDGKEFDFTKPITEDTELYAVWEGDTDASILQK